MDSPHEVIYFNVRFVMSDNPSQESRRGTYYTNFFNDVNPEKQTAIPISSSLGQNDKAQLPVNIPHSIRWNKNSQRCVFSCLVGIYAPKQPQTEESLLLYRIRPVPAMSKQDRESLIIRFNASMKCNRLLRQEKSTITCHHFRGVSLRQK